MTSRWYGTRIVTLPCINGIVICADKSLNDLNGMVLTNRIKIHQLGRKAAFSMTGLARANALDPTLAPVWDPVKTIEDFFADKNLNYIDRHKEPLARTLENAMYATFVTRNGLPAAPEREECQILIWHFDAHNMLHGVKIVTDFHSSRIRQAQASISESDIAGPNLFGDCDPSLAIRSGKFPELEDLRNDPHFKAMQSARELWKAMSAAEVVDIGCFVISASSRAAAIATPENSISENCDCCLLDGCAGFKWINASPAV